VRLVEAEPAGGRGLVGVDREGPVVDRREQQTGQALAHDDGQELVPQVGREGPLGDRARRTEAVAGDPPCEVAHLPPVHRGRVRVRPALGSAACQQELSTEPCRRVPGKSLAVITTLQAP
jgi:hypothetical protein